MQQQCYEEDTIDLRELWAVLRKRKRLIWFITGVVTLAALAYVLLVRPVYEVKGVVELAQIDKKAVQNANDLRQKLSFIYGVNTKGKKREYPIVQAITLPKKSKNLLIVTARGYNNASAKKKLENVIEYVKKIQDKELKFYVETQKKSLALTTSDLKRNQQLIAQIQEDLKNYQKKLLSISKQSAALAGIYSIEIGKKQTELNDVTNQLYALRDTKNSITLSISPLKIHKTVIVGSIEELDKPVKPKKKLIVIVAFITGLMLSVFIAFFLEFIQSERKE
ncbi:Wzz/FepE/Etk N-terminal domain-containing protein [Sulfurimonas sp.]|uniref:Wzz/FepE/Etk N-terminal domain-containing protein n=1 Tax=Sulfurimonas sp. TaxID=2022749 RepID=UPI00260BA8A3|nr:Wzz/FepE/Etk N-terminal domain-containing protein [Sulfurimonas sp.]